MGFSYVSSAPGLELHLPTGPGASEAAGRGSAVKAGLVRGAEALWRNRVMLLMVLAEPGRPSGWWRRTPSRRQGVDGAPSITSDAKVSRASEQRVRRRAGRSHPRATNSKQKD